MPKELFALHLQLMCVNISEKAMFSALGLRYVGKSLIRRDLSIRQYPRKSYLDILNEGTIIINVHNFQLTVRVGSHYPIL